MNKQRRLSIKELQTQLLGLKRQLEKIQNDEQDAFDNMPEGLQSSMRGEESEEAIDAMENALSNIDDALGYLGDIIL